MSSLFVLALNVELIGVYEWIDRQTNIPKYFCSGLLEVSLRYIRRSFQTIKTISLADIGSVDSYITSGNHFLMFYIQRNYYYQTPLNISPLFNVIIVLLF